MTDRLGPDWLRGQPLNDIEITILTIETLCGDDSRALNVAVEKTLGWTTPYYEDNVRWLAVDERADKLAPGLTAVLLERYPGDPADKVWSDAEAFTRRNHL